jgi:hypothetical protein
VYQSQRTVQTSSVPTENDRGKLMMVKAAAPDSWHAVHIGLSLRFGPQGVL